MLIFALDRILHFLSGSFLHSQLGETANLNFSTLTLSLTVSHIGPRFIAELRFEPHFFLQYFPSHCRIQTWRISLKQLCDHLRDAINCSSTVFILNSDNPPRVLLTFRDSSLGIFGPIGFRREMMLSNPEDQEDLGEIKFASFVSIDSQDFKRIVIEFRNIDSVLVTLTNLQVKFSSESKEIILSKEEGRCIIEGIRVGKEIQFQINLQPTTFFDDLTYRTKRIWLHQTNKVGGAIYAPIYPNVQFEIYFPPM